MAMDFSFDLSSIGSDRRKPDQAETYHTIVVGGGPAAMAAAIYTARKMMKVAVISADIGGQVGTTTDIDNYLGFQSISGSELVAKFTEQIEQFDLPMITDQKVVKVTRDEGLFRVETSMGEFYTAHSVIMATGKRDKHLGVPGENEFLGKGVHYCATCDAPFYKNKKVLVAGGGNSGFTAVLDLIKLTDEVILINRSPGWKADEIMQKNVKRYVDSGKKVHMLDAHVITEIHGDGKVSSVTLKDNRTEQTMDIELDGVFVEIGLEPNSEPIQGLAAVNEFKELIVDCHCRTNVAGLYGAGDVTTVPYKQIVISAGEGAKAALSAYEDLTMRGLL